MFVTLMYHIVDRRIDTPIAVSEESFEAQLAHIRREGFTALTLADVLRLVSGEGAPPDRGVFVTLDDGYADNLYAALPRLQEHGFEATLFVPTAYVGQSNGWNPRADYEVRHLDWEELERWLDGGGRIGGHTHEHLSAGGARRDEFAASIELNRRLLKQRLGIDVVAFAYPYGVATPEAREEVSRWCQVAWVADGGTPGTWDPRRDRFLLNRVFIGPKLRLDDFARRLARLFDELATA
jgi:peptidoglycan/xylan/chitin deacetylase (PgdA/CDA1 family)